MEFLLISPEKIKIMLTAEDMEQYKLNAQTMDYNMNKTREVIRELLKIANQRTGFEADGERIFIQAFPCKNGDCELYISKLGQFPATSHKDGELSGIMVSVIFEELSDLISLCNKICLIHSIYDDCIYYDNYKNNYILSFKMRCEGDGKREMTIISAILREFNGNVVSHNTLYASAEERYSCLCGVNAMELFAKLEQKTSYSEYE